MEKERDELKGQLQETERKLHEKTCRVVELEHNLEEVATDSIVSIIGNARNEGMN